MLLDIIVIYQANRHLCVLASQADVQAMGTHEHGQRETWMCWV